MDKRDRLLWVPFPTVFYLFVFQLPLTSHSSSCPCSLLWVFLVERSARLGLPLHRSLE